MRNPEQWRKRRNLGYGATAVMALAIDALTVYANIKGFEAGKFQHEPFIPIILDGVILAGNAGLIWAYRKYQFGNRSRMVGGYDEHPADMRERSRGFYRRQRPGDRLDSDYPDDNLLN